MTDGGLKELQLATLKNLTTLFIHTSKLTDAGMKELTALKNLTLLNISGNGEVTGLGWTEIKSVLPNCKIISQ